MNIIIPPSHPCFILKLYFFKTLFRQILQNLGKVRTMIAVHKFAIVLRLNNFSKRASGRMTRYLPTSKIILFFYSYYRWFCPRDGFSGQIFGLLLHHLAKTNSITNNLFKVAVLGRERFVSRTRKRDKTGQKSRTPRIFSPFFGFCRSLLAINDCYFMKTIK
jgi:uncharacterized membrane protein YobD (UPF0266 family)